MATINFGGEREENMTGEEKSGINGEKISESD